MMAHLKRWLIVGGWGLIFTLAACSQQARELSEVDRTVPFDAQLAELIPAAHINVPAEPIQHDAALVTLGEALFWDPILSGNRDIACATCHHPAFGMGDGLPLSVGTGGIGLGPERVKPEDREWIARNAPDIFNRGLAEWTSMFWDSRVSIIDARVFDSPAAYRLPDGLENVLAVQAIFPVLATDEMRGDRGDLDIFEFDNDLAKIKSREIHEIWDSMLSRLLDVPAFQDLFLAAYPRLTIDQIGIVQIGDALAAYQADTFTFLDAPWDLYLQGEMDALTDQQKEGAILFHGEAGCSTCHSGFLLTDQEHYNLAVPQLGPGKGVSDPIDPGRLLETGEEGDRFSFRTPPLRNITLTGPYMHNGAYRDLASAIQHHFDPVASLQNYDLNQLPAEFWDVVNNDKETQQAIIQWLSPEVAQPIAVTDAQLDALLAFMEALTSPSAVDLSHTIPAEVPSGLQVGGLIGD